MSQSIELNLVSDKINQLKQAAEALKQVAGEIPSVDRNVERLMAVVRVLELGFCDVSEI